METLDIPERLISPGCHRHSPWNEKTEHFTVQLWDIATHRSSVLTMDCELTYIIGW